MPRNGSGVMSLPAGYLAVTGETITATQHNSPLEDIASEITGSVPRNGAAAMTAALPMGTFKITGLGAGTAATDAARLSQVQSGVVSQAATVGGTVDAITLIMSPVTTAYTSGEVTRWVSAGANTVTNPTVNRDNIGAKTIKKGASAALVAGDTGAAGYICEAVYNGTDFILRNPASALGLDGAASTTEVLTGTNAAKAVTPDALAALWEKGSDTASAGTTSFGEGGYLHVTGTTTITDIDFSTAKDGRGIIVQFDGILTLTHHATTLVLPGGVNITTAAGDTACFIQDSGDNIKCLWYCKAQAAVYGGWVPDVILEDQKASGTDGGTFTSGADRTRTLNTEVRDIHGICSLAANQFTLPAGTYYVEWTAPACQVGFHQTLLYNATDASEVKRGVPLDTPTGASGTYFSFGQATVTIAGAKAFEIRHRCQTTRSTNGLGSAASFGTEIYTVVKISKIAV